MKEIEPSSKEKAHWMDRGKYYGYPDCCIQSFLSGSLLEEISEEQQKVNRGTGFIPCKKHAHMILDGKCTLESLIQISRKCPTSFPEDDSEKSYVKRYWNNRFEGERVVKRWGGTIVGRKIVIEDRWPDMSMPPSLHDAIVHLLKLWKYKIKYTRVTS